MYASHRIFNSVSKIFQPMLNDIADADDTDHFSGFNHEQMWRTVLHHQTYAGFNVSSDATVIMAGVTTSKTTMASARSPYGETACTMSHSDMSPAAASPLFANNAAIPGSRILSAALLTVSFARIVMTSTPLLHCPYGPFRRVRARRTKAARPSESAFIIND
jgi:hypothetical protein